MRRSADSVTVRIPSGRFVTVRVMRSWLRNNSWMSRICAIVAASCLLAIAEPLSSTCTA